MPLRGSGINLSYTLAPSPAFGLPKMAEEFKAEFEGSLNRESQDSIPVIDLSPFLQDEYSTNPCLIQSRKSVIEQIAKAGEEWGFFQVINHGIPMDIMEEALATAHTFFEYPVEEKMKIRPGSRIETFTKPFTTGYNVYPPGGWDLYENLYYSAGVASGSSMDFSDGNAQYNLFPEDLPQFRSVIEKLLLSLGKTAAFMESLVSQSLGLPANFLEEYNHDKVEPLKVLCYPKATTAQLEIGAWQHQDSSCITLVGQDETGGYQVLKDGIWIDIIPTRGALVVNIGDILQVWTNNRFKSAMHRVVNNRERRRCSFAYATVPNPEKWVSPLPHFTTHINCPAAYRSFFYKDYMAKRIHDKIHPPAKAEDFADISIYSTT
eukprot:Gb_08828 [translate_table: standard]